MSKTQKKSRLFWGNLVVCPLQTPMNRAIESRCIQIGRRSHRKGHMREHMSFSVAIYIAIKRMTLLRLTVAGCSNAPNPTAAGGRSREGEEVPKQGA